MSCRHKEYADECEILVCVDAPAPLKPSLYSRLRFGLLASLWLPILLGIFLWSALYVMLLIVGGIFWVLGLLAASLYSVILLCLVGIYYCCYLLLLGLLAVVLDLVCLLVNLIAFCWTLVVGLLACQEPSSKCTGGPFWTFETWKDFKCGMEDFCETCEVPLGVPCMSGSLYQETKDQKLETWARWFEEVMHKHEAIAL